MADLDLDFVLVLYLKFVREYKNPSCLRDHDTCSFGGLGKSDDQTGHYNDVLNDGGDLSNNTHS